MSKKNIRFYWILLVIFILCGVIAYFNTINSFFLSDDFVLISAISKNGPFAVWTHSPWSFFRPLISLSLFIDYKLWELNPIGYHFTNILIHSLNSFFVFLISFLLVNKIQLFKKRIWGLPLFSGFIFLILPCHTEAVAWISGRTDVIATFFYLSSFCTYLFYKQNSKISYLLISILLFVCALFSKESVITYPFVILSYEIYSYTIEQDNSRKFVHALYLPLIYCILLGLYLSVRCAAIGAIIGGHGSNVHLYFDFSQMFRNSILYSARTFLPPMSIEIMAILFLIGMAVILIVTVFIVWSKSKALVSKIASRMPKILYFLLIAFVISLLPVINLGISIINTQSERFIYLPSVFSSIFLIFLLNFIINNKKYFVISFVCLLLFFGNSLYRSNEIWRKAGEISKSILGSLKTLGKANRLFIVNLPDNINGAYIYRNGIRNAICLFGNTNQFKNIIIISYNNIYKMDDTVMITKSSDMYTVRLLNPKASFVNANVPIENTFSTKYYEIVNFTNNGYNLRFKKFKSNDKLTFYSAGRMITPRF